MSGSDPYKRMGIKTAPSAPSRKKDKGHHGIMGLVENLGHDVLDMATGIPTGIVSMVEHPIKSTEEIGKQTWQTWSPLFHGNVSEFGHDFYAHPLAPILDVASIITLGAGTAARGAKALSDAGKVGEASRIARFAKYSENNVRMLHSAEDPLKPGLPKFYSKNPAAKKVEQGLERVSNDLAGHLPDWWGKHAFGEESRYKRAELKDSFTRRVAMQQQIATYIAAAKKLDDPGEREQLLRHAYDQLNTMAFRHDASKPIPSGFRAIKAIPTMAGVHLANKNLEQATARLSGLGANLSRHFGRKVDHTSRDSIQKSLNEVQAELRKSNSAASKASDVRAKTVEIGKTADALKTKLDKLNADMARMHEKGWTVKAKDTKAARSQKQKASGEFKALDRVQTELARTQKAYDKAIEAKLSHEKALKQGHEAAKTQDSLVKQQSILRKMLDQDAEVRKATKDHQRATDAHAVGHGNFFKSEDVEDSMRRFGGKYTVRPMKNGRVREGRQVVTVDNGKNILIVPTHTLKRFEKEGERSAGALKYLYHKPTHVWKSIILGYTPRYLVNNAVGNTFMYAMSEGGPSGFRAYVDALRQTKKERKVIHELKSADDLVKFSYQDKWFKDQLNNTLGYSNLSRVLNPTKRGKLQEGLFPVTHTWADQVLRRATLIKAMRENPAFKKLRKEGLSEDAAANRVLHQDAQNGGILRREISKRVEDSLGDYHTLNSFETKLRQIVPFYAWDRHIARHTKHLLKNHTTRVNFLAKTGVIGAEETKNILGEVPGFLTGALPLSMLGIHVDHNRRKAILTTQGLNPYATLPELFDSAKHLTVGGEGRPGESAGSLLNPIIGGGMEALTGHSMISDAPAKTHGGALVSPYVSSLMTLPYVKLAEHLLNGPEEPKRNKRTHRKTPFMYEKDATTDLLSLLGLPVKQYNGKRGREIAKRG